MTRAQRRKRLRELYAQVPKVECKGLCAESCGPIQCSDTERDTIEQRAGKPLRPQPHPEFGRNMCSMLSPAGRCTVYGDRPMICRLWGAIPEMRCPHGCRVTNPVERDQGFVLMGESIDAGGGTRARLVKDAAATIRRALADPELAAVARAMVARGMGDDARRMRE